MLRNRVFCEPPQTEERALPAGGGRRPQHPRSIPQHPAASDDSRQNQVIASVSRRYAKALLSLGLETGEHEKLAESLDSVVRAIAASDEARTLAQNPGYTQAQRQQLVDV